MNDSDIHIGVIASMKRGLEHFVYREMMMFEEEGAAISVFTTKYQPGSYNPRDHWRLYRCSALWVLLWQPVFLLSSPRKYLRLLLHAIRMSAVTDFLIGWYYSRSMRAVDLIYATFGDRKLYVGYFCKQILGKPLVATVHAYELYANPNPRLFAPALQVCDRIVMVTEYNRELLCREYGVDPSKVDLVRFSVPLDEFRPAEKFVVLIVAFFAERKGHDVLFRAVKKLNDENIEIWVVGDEGPEQPTVDVKGLADELGMESQVAFFGKLSGTALSAVYQACDVFCLPCRTDSHGIAEGFPTVIMEAMAFGKPIITTRHVEIPRVLDEILVDENDVDGLAEAIDRVRRSARLCRELGRQNRELAEHVFAPRNTAQKVRIFRSVVEQHAASRVGDCGPVTELSEGRVGIAHRDH